MNSAAIQRKDDGSIDLTITIPWADVAKQREKVVEKAVADTELPGFRKGKAPRAMVEKNLNMERVKEEVLRQLLPTFYIEAIKQHDLKPIMNPRIHVEKLDDEKDWQFRATTCEMPTIDLGDYKKRVQNVTAKSKIAIPGKEPQEVKLEDIVKALVDGAKANIPAILIEQEADKLLSQTLDDIKRLGLTLDQYLASTGKSAEDLRADYAQRAANDLMFEFILQKIAEDEKITVEEKEIDQAIAASKDEKERESLQQNRYLLAGIIRQQKTLDFLRNL